MKLSCWRKLNKISVVECAKLLGCHRFTIWKFENRGVMPSTAMLEKIADLTGGKVLPNDFFVWLPDKAKRAA